MHGYLTKLNTFIVNAKVHFALLDPTLAFDSVLERLFAICAHVDVQ